MSKLKCNCGYIIADQAYSLSYKADFLPDSSREDLWKKIVETLKLFNEAKDKRQKEEWMNKNFSVPPYPTDLPDHEMVWDLIHNSFNELTRAIYQCESFGRIWIQQGRTENFISFMPETNDWKGILNSTK